IGRSIKNPVLINIPSNGMNHFSRVSPIGPISSYQFSMGHHYAKPGFLNLNTGQLTRSGLSLNQPSFYALDSAVDTFIYFCPKNLKED
ncbi:MAG: hypothetical protein ACRC37_00570, partial [Lentisphaeria bacterium]